MDREKVLQHVIEGYRTVIFNRYQYKNIKEKYTIPNTITEETVTNLRNYYLTHIYPEYSKRKALNEAFESLDDYTKHPQKLINILLDASILLFKFGRHLRKIFNTGLKALKTFKAAANFENTFVDEAIKQDLKPPFNEAKINVLLQSIPRKEIDTFITTSQSLFETLHDRKQVKRIKEMMQYIIKVMKKKQHSYTKSQINGLQLGYNLLDEGDKLFMQLTKKDQKELIYLITTIEKDMLNNIH